MGQPVKTAHWTAMWRHLRHIDHPIIRNRSGPLKVKKMAEAICQLYQVDIQQCESTRALARACYDHLVDNRLPHTKLKTPSISTPKKSIKVEKSKAQLHAEWVISHAFLQSYEWRKVRYAVVVRCKGRCEACGAGKEQGIILHVDHIKPRRKRPDLALDPTNLQGLCEPCNHGKGNWDETDWREPSAA